MIDLDLLNDFSRDVAMATNFGQHLQNDRHSAGWRSETVRNVAVWIQKILVEIL